jgi:hypothetical protein
MYPQQSNMGVIKQESPFNGSDGSITRCSIVNSIEVTFHQNADVDLYHH